MSEEKEKEYHDRLPPGQTPIGRLLRWGIDHPGIRRSNPKIDLKTYVLTVEGEVDESLELRWSDIARFPNVHSVSDFHCVEGWSVLDCDWEGIQFREIVAFAKPRGSARFVTFECADGYTTSLALEELLADGVLLACGLNGKPLEEGYGFPLRLVVPSKYGYKSALWITRIRFTSTKEAGFWEKRGYSDSADVWKNDRFSK